MPISVKCPSCSAAFSVKDEYAGKRAKCPSCKEPLTIPGVADTVKMPPPAVAARPVVASKPKPMPVDDAVEDDGPKSKRRRDEEDEDEKPRARKRRDEDDEEAPKSKRRRDEGADEDAPRGKRRRRDDDDDTPKKKGSALPLILGIVGGVLLLCGGGCAGVWFGVIAPAAEKARARNSEWQAELDEFEKKMNTPPPNQAAGTKVTEANLAKLRAGMTLAQVEEVLGKGKAADEFDMVRGVTGTPSDQAWMAKRQQNLVYAWGGGSDVILVAFTTSPTSGGTVAGVRGAFGVNTIEQVKLVGGGGVPNPNPAPPQPPANTEVVVTAEALVAEFDKDAKAAADKYKDKVLRVTGTLVEVDTQFGNFVKVKGGQPPATAKTITVVGSVAFAATGSVKRLKAGATVTFTCRYEKFTQPKPNQPWELKLSDFKVAR